MQNVMSWGDGETSICVSEIFEDEIGVIGAGVCGEDAEEIAGGHDLAASLFEVIFKESKEGFLANAGAQVFEEVRAAKINCIFIKVGIARFVNGSIYKAIWLKEIDTVGPPFRD